MTDEQLQFQINSSINACNARLENGAGLTEAFQWLQEEVIQIFEGKLIYSLNS